jgi:hypothetical protein
LPTFLLGKSGYDISREDIERQASLLQPDLLPARKFSVRITGKTFPVKQLIVAAVGIPPDAFTTLEACKVLAGLGYDVEYNK